MRELVWDGNVVVYGCHALGRFLRNYHATIAAGVPSVLVATIRAHMSNLAVVRIGCKTLGLVAGFAATANAGMQDLIDAGGIQISLFALRAHAGDISAAATVFKSIDVIAQVPSGRAAIIAAGGRYVIVTAEINAMVFMQKTAVLARLR